MSVMHRKSQPRASRGVHVRNGVSWVNAEPLGAVDLPAGGCCSSEVWSEARLSERVLWG